MKLFNVQCCAAATGDGKPLTKADLEEDDEAGDEGNESPR